ncbi:MAG: hypothetical protein M3O22_00350 [Pseudomonadota bacterium]|nr:hypothetical protein [Pseudomonadota bacterium]
MLRYLVFLMLLVVSFPAQAENYESLDPRTGNNLLALCKEAETQGKYLSTGLCFGYIAGVLETAAFVEKSNNVCLLNLPQGLTFGQAARIFIKHAEEKPEILHYRSAQIVFASMIQAFPCKTPE